MFLKRHACRFAATHPTDHIWISDDFLNHALSRYVQLYVGRRHGSAIPGPLEARKRAAKRRMMGLAPTTAGLDPHPGFLAGLGQGHENQQSWQWQSPRLPQPKHPPTSLDDGNECCPTDHVGPNSPDNPALSPWLTNHNHTEEEIVAEEGQHYKPVEQVDIEEAAANADHEANPDTPIHENPEARREDNTHIDSMREIVKSFQEYDPMRKTSSRLGLCQLLDLGCDMDKILEFWADPLLNPWRAGNLSFFIAHCVEYSKLHEMRRFCDWTVRQFRTGACPDRDILQLVTELSEFRERDSWQELLGSLCDNAAQALRSSPVLRVEDISFETFSSLLAIMFDDVYCLSRLELGLNLVKGSSSAQRQGLVSLVWPTIERWVSMWEPSRSEELSSMTLSSTITTLLCTMPYNELLQIVRDVSWRILDHPLTEEDSIISWKKHSLWWSAIRAPGIFQHIKKTSFWLEISDAIRKRQEDAIKSTILTEIDKLLKQNKLQAAYQTFLKYHQVTLESCPHLAEALILDPNRDWRAALLLREIRQITVPVKQHSTGDDHVTKHLQQLRVRLLERMALAYAQQEHIPPPMIFFYAYGCWKIHERDNLGPMGSAMIHALALCGIVRPIQAGHQVSRTRLEWILRMVAEVEGVDASTKLGASIHGWLNEAYQQARTERHNLLGEAYEQARAERRRMLQHSLSQGANPWDGLTAMAQAQPNAPPNHGRSAQPNYKASPVIDMYSATLANGKGGQDQEQAVIDENDGGEAQLTEEAFMSDLASDTAAFIDSTTSSPIPEVSLEADEPEDILQHNVRYVSQDEVSKAQAPERPQEAMYISINSTRDATVDTDTGQGHSFKRLKIVREKRTRAEALDLRSRERRVHVLLARLNATRILSSDEAGTSSSSFEIACLPELPPISPCSLVLSAGNPVQLKKVYIWRKRILGSRGWNWPRLRHGMREYQEHQRSNVEHQGPTTFGNAKEPALGGWAGYLFIPRVLQLVARSEEHLNLGLPDNGRGTEREE
ncbi:MAG: hypothetical protein Q9226_003163 [Calogaya cf. arnoldii]